MKKVVFFSVVTLLICSAGSLFAADAKYYVLDGFGGVHSGGGAPTISPATPYFGFDVAKDIAYVPVGNSTAVGDGLLVLDGFGGVHYGGALAATPPVGTTPYFGFDVARGITYRNVTPRAAFTSTSSGNTDVTSSTYVTVAQTNIFLPDDGYVLIAGNLCMGNNDTNEAIARIAVGVDGAEVDNINREVDLPPVSSGTSWRSETVVQMDYLPAGAHTFELLVRKSSGTGDVTYFDAVVSAIYIDQNQSGFSDLPPRQDGPTGSEGVR